MGETMKINFGVGRQYRDGWVNVDFDKHLKAEIYHDLTQFPYPFKSQEASEILASHIIEHLTAKDRMEFLKECRRILRPGGTLRIETPIAYTWAAAHLNHTDGGGFTPWSFKIFEQSEWNWEFESFRILRMRVFMPFLWRKPRIPLPWQFIYANCFINNFVTKMEVILIKDGT